MSKEVTTRHKQNEDKGHSYSECHENSKLKTIHFNDLNTPHINQAAQTIVDGLNYNGEYCFLPVASIIRTINMIR
jgi:hypothetical protein